MMQVNRDRLLHQLRSVYPGTDSREFIEQSACFVFFEGRIRTFNDEISCSAKSPINIKGAVAAEALIRILKSIDDERITMTVKTKGTRQQLLIRAKSSRGGTILAPNILLPIHLVDEPRKWRPIPSDFTEALKLVYTCASLSTTDGILTYIHLHPEYVEACDRVQAARYRIDLPLKRPILIPNGSIQRIMHIIPKKFSVTPQWIHFKTDDDLILSCRYIKDEFADLGPLFDISGESIMLPADLKRDISAQEWLASRTNDPRVRIAINENRMIIYADNEATWWAKMKRIEYVGPSISFLVSPELLIEISNRYPECEITETRLKAEFGKFKYVTALGNIKTDE